jgi:hypothetical protein
MRSREKWETLEIELEEAGDCSWWSSLLAPVDPKAGNAYLRFVGRVWGPDGRETEVIRGEAFPRFLDPDELAPDDAWTPGWELSLVHLKHRIEEEGWQRAGCGLEPWSHRYVRFAGLRGGHRAGRSIRRVAMVGALLRRTVMPAGDHAQPLGH